MASPENGLEEKTTSRTTLERVAALYAGHGVSGLARAVRERIYERTEFVAGQRDLTLPMPKPRCSVEFRLQRIDDVTMRRFKDMGQPFRRHYEYRFEYGMRRCYGALQGDRIVALMWPLFQVDNKRTVTRWRYLLPDEARISNAWADPEFRGTGLIDSAFERITAVIAAGGFRYMYGFTWIGNHSSRKFQARLGYKEVARVYQYAFRWQREGGGLYLRERIPREPMAPGHRLGDMDLPEVIPQLAGVGPRSA